RRRLCLCLLRLLHFPADQYLLIELFCPNTQDRHLSSRKMSFFPRRLSDWRSQLFYPLLHQLSLFSTRFTGTGIFAAVPFPRHLIVSKFFCRKITMRLKKSLSLTGKSFYDFFFGILTVI